ncbi:hypothetical protein D3C85_1173360 [compost metagenome]
MLYVKVMTHPGTHEDDFCRSESQSNGCLTMPGRFLRDLPDILRQAVDCWRGEVCGSRVHLSWSRLRPPSKGWRTAAIVSCMSALRRFVPVIAARPYGMSSGVWLSPLSASI